LPKDFEFRELALNSGELFLNQRQEAWP